MSSLTLSDVSSTTENEFDSRWHSENSLNTSAVAREPLWMSQQELSEFFDNIRASSSRPVAVDEIFEYDNGMRCTVETYLMPVPLDELIEAGATNPESAQSKRIRMKRPGSVRMPLPWELLPVLKHTNSSLVKM